MKFKIRFNRFNKPISTSGIHTIDANEIFNAYVVAGFPVNMAPRKGTTLRAH